jgi:hypothetical protein
LIYFTFRDDTYVIPFVFTCMLIIGGFAAGVRILLEKGPSRHHILKISKILKKYQKIIFIRRLKKLEGGSDRGHRAASPLGGAAQPLAAPTCGESPLAHFCHRPFAYLIVPKNLSQGRLRDRHRRLCGAKNTRERKALR